MSSSNRQATLLIAALASAGALAAAPVAGQAQTLESSYFALKPMFGLGGEVGFDGRGSAHEALGPSFGAGLQYMARLHRHFALGALLALQSWQSAPAADAGRERNYYIDAAVVPAGVLPLTGSVELYAAFGLGLSMDFVHDEELPIDRPPMLAGEDGLEIDEAIGLVLLPVVGARFALSSDVGLLAELGYALRSYEHDWLLWTPARRVADEPFREPFDLSLGQVALNLGVFF